MRRSTLNQSGFSYLLVFVAVVAFAAVSVVGYRAVSSHQTAPSSTVSESQAVPATITTKADITKATAALDDTAIDKGINPNQFDADISAL